MNTYDIKTVADAAAELTRKTTQTVGEASTKLWKEFYAFGDVVAKAQSEALREMTTGHGYGDLFATATKFQTEATKNFTKWAETLYQNNGK